jgi:hypothetical protein
VTTSPKTFQKTYDHESFHHADMRAGILDKIFKKELSLTRQCLVKLRAITLEVHPQANTFNKIMARNVGIA